MGCDNEVGCSPADVSLRTNGHWVDEAVAWVCTRFDMPTVAIADARNVVTAERFGKNKLAATVLVPQYEALFGRATLRYKQCPGVVVHGHGQLIQLRRVETHVGANWQLLVVMDRDVIALPSAKLDSGM